MTPIRCSDIRATSIQRTAPETKPAKDDFHVGLRHGDQEAGFTDLGHVRHDEVRVDKLHVDALAFDLSSKGSSEGREELLRSSVCREHGRNGGYTGERTSEEDQTTFAV